MEVSKFLKQYGFYPIENDLGIKVSRHDTLPLMVMNYNQIDSPKTNAIVRECRGLVLNSEDFEPVARGFDRFFNWGEVVEEMDLFDFSNFTTTEKVDGSYILIYFFRGNWMLNTRGSFGNGPVNNSILTWDQIFCLAMGIENLQELHLPKDKTYVFELCSRHNKVVRDYEKPVTFLLGCRDSDGNELSDDDTNNLANELGLNRPNHFHMKSIQEILDFLLEKESNDPTFEGVVIRDCHNHRWKVKTSTYVALHHMKGNDNSFNYKGVLPFIMSGEVDELLTYFPEVNDLVNEMTNKISEEYNKLVSLWRSVHLIEDQKEFALRVKDFWFSSILFRCRRDHKAKETEKDVEKFWKDSSELILKHLFK